MGGGEGVRGESEGSGGWGMGLRENGSRLRWPPTSENEGGVTCGEGKARGGKGRSGGTGAGGDRARGLGNNTEEGGRKGRVGKKIWVKKWGAAGSGLRGGVLRRKPGELGLGKPGGGGRIKKGSEATGGTRGWGDKARPEERRGAGGSPREKGLRLRLENPRSPQRRGRGAAPVPARLGRGAGKGGASGCFLTTREPDRPMHLYAPPGVPHGPAWRGPGRGAGWERLIGGPM